MVKETKGGVAVKLADIFSGIDFTDMRAPADMELTGICCDSRLAAPGCLFTAIRGTASDGHGFIKSAVENGAACVLCETPPDIDIPYVTAPDTKTALALAAANYFGRPADRLKIIGVTGTNGKTTVTHLIKQMLENLTGRPVGLIGSIHDMLGGEIISSERTTPTTPDAITLHGLFAKMAAGGCEYAVMEVSSHALELGRVAGITFELGVLTNLTQDHLDFHGGMEEYARAKARLFTQSRRGAVNADDAAAEALARGDKQEFARGDKQEFARGDKQEFARGAQCEISTFTAKSDSADLAARLVKLLPGKVEFCALMIGELERTELNIPGMFSVYNALAAMLSVRLFGFGLDAVAHALAQCAGVKGRAETVPTGRDFTVLIDYAHTPDALKNIIEAVRGCAAGRVVTLFGCGGDRDKTKRPLMGEIAAKLSDFVIVTSDNPRTEAPEEIINQILGGMKNSKTPYAVIENRREAIYWAIENSKPGDTLILAGKGHETYQEIHGEKSDFDERVIVAEALEAAAVSVKTAAKTPKRRQK
ncbi:MAG: UDP-N-acetylmuramoyl-L-alanyl-D-glutamate--2,6-diaminopimelate ligase [Oscillospiraceae bacterium]|jgi:UDP-N-acetylmuramoyl-L-alanyl-D-glutamate--2,6-diaminopimelate ligase|nr:UDP-N-acetylmuramoyl-L-alanyl-D-glutamate--2,6-diaminopimelate ligase [Oscillospiraceae bacterium]